MDRRSSLRKMALASGSMVVLPAWARGWRKEILFTDKSCFSSKELEFLSAVTDTLIPSGQENTGALSLGVDQFLNLLFSDCYEPDIQKKIKLQLNQINQKALKDYGVTFKTCTTPQKLSILEQFACSDDQGIQGTFKLIKNETIRGFRTSKVVMTEYMNYQVMPGHFYGCVEVSS